MSGRRALEGIRVLELGQVMAGPFCALQLCDMGADVIKVEPPDGDPTRQMGARAGTDSACFAAMNRGKRGIVLDLKSAAGRDALVRLAARADIFIENFRPGVMRAAGAGLSGAVGRQRTADLRVDLGLRPDGTRPGQRRIRSGRARRVRVDVGDRRARRAAGQGRRAAHRSWRGALRARRDSRGPAPSRAAPAAASTSTRRSSRPVSRSPRGSRPSSLPAARAGGDGLRASIPGAVSGDSVRRRVHHDRRRHGSAVRRSRGAARASRMDGDA